MTNNYYMEQHKVDIRKLYAIYMLQGYSHEKSAEKAIEKTVGLLGLNKKRNLKEIRRFHRVWDVGLRKLHEMAQGSNNLTNKQSLDMYLVHGFPIEVTKIICNHYGYIVSAEGFWQAKNDFDNSSLEYAKGAGKGYAEYE